MEKNIIKLNGKIGRMNLIPGNQRRTYLP